MINKITFFFLLFPLAACNAGSAKQEASLNAKRNHLFRQSLYAGIIGGYGSTTWEGLVPTIENQNPALSLSTPIDVSEGGGVIGAFAGYEISRYFAVEASYMRYPDAKIHFDAQSIFSFLHDEQTEFISTTETISFMGKVMIFVPGTNIRFFSSLGGANVHRRDVLNETWRLSPTFGAGFNYHFSEYIMGELGANYTAGFGESNLNPTDSYIPFLYSYTFRLALCF